MIQKLKQLYDIFHQIVLFAYPLVLLHWVYLLHVRIPRLRTIRSRITFDQPIEFVSKDLRCPQCRTECTANEPVERTHGLELHYCKACGAYTHAVNDPEPQSPYPAPAAPMPFSPNQPYTGTEK